MSDDPMSIGVDRAPHIRVLAQYTKAITFNTRDGAQTADMNNPPKIELGIDLQTNTIVGPQGIYETVLNLMGAAIDGDEELFRIELSYAGVFDLSGVPENRLDPILMIDCPQLLFPFARRVIADVTREGGFPPLLIDPIDFITLYRNRNQSQA